MFTTTLKIDNLSFLKKNKKKSLFSIYVHHYYPKYVKHTDVSDTLRIALQTISFTEDSKNFNEQLRVQAAPLMSKS